MIDYVKIDDKEIVVCEVKLRIGDIVELKDNYINWLLPEDKNSNIVVLEGHHFKITKFYLGKTVNNNIYYRLILDDLTFFEKNKYSNYNFIQARYFKISIIETRKLKLKKLMNNE